MGARLTDAEVSAAIRGDAHPGHTSELAMLMPWLVPSAFTPPPSSR
jgi:hypothetical protein